MNKSSRLTPEAVTKAMSADQQAKQTTLVTEEMKRKRGLKTFTQRLHKSRTKLDRTS